MDVNIGKEITLAVDTTKLNPDVMAHVIYIGLKNILQDTHAGEGNSANARALAERKLDSMYNGIVRAVGEREGDPIKAEAIRMALDAIKKAIRKAGKKVESYDAKALRKTATDNAGLYMEIATKRVAELKANNIEVDVSGLV